MRKSGKSWDLTLMAAVLIIASACWTSCGSSGGGGGDGPPGAPPSPPPPPLPTSSEGWTELTPSVDTLTVYVSDSDGDDADDGLTPATAKKTLSAGKALLRTGMPDWMLLKAGDTWTNQDFGNITKSGRGSLEPLVISTYGTGARPLVRTGTGNGMSMTSTAVSHVAFVGIHLEAHLYTGSEGSTGIRLLTTCDDILIEDCFIEGYKDNFVVQANNGPGTISNIRVRRCVVVDAYSTTSSHAQGFYGAGIDGLLLEECVFDQNGWQGGSGAPATVFNHNTYMEDCSNIIIRGNFILRASSIGNKFIAESTGASQGILIENNFYLEGEIGISCGGNANGPLRFSNVTVRDNVMMHIGRTAPTNRDLAWHLDVQDWDGGAIEDNLFLHQGLMPNCYGVELGGESERLITISGNLFYGLKEMAVNIAVANSEADISIVGNEFQDPTESSKLVVHSGTFAETTYQNNVYFSNASASAWFNVNGDLKSYAEWLTLSGETGSSAVAVSYLDPNRDETTYQASLGGTATLAAFVAEIRQQSKAFWRPAYMADAINDYIRAGFGR